MDSPVKSPAPGLEKLASELRQERQKCTNALQDRAKQKIEIERLKQQLQDSQEDFLNTEENYKRLSESYVQLEKSIGELDSRLGSKDEEIARLSKLNSVAEEELELSRNGLKSSVDSCNSLQQECEMMGGKIEELESILTAKSALIEELEEEAAQLKRLNELHSNRLKEATYELNRRSEELDSVRREGARVEAISASYVDLQQSSDEVRIELEQALQRNAELTSRLRETQESNRSMQLSEQKQRLEISSLSSQITKLHNELRDHNQMQIELTRKADAEVESASLSRDKASEAIRSKQYLEEQVLSLKSAHEKALKRCEDLEEEAVQLNSRIMNMQGDIGVMGERLRAKDKELTEAENQRAVAAEVETLRGQLSEMRKKLLRKDLDAEVDRISPAAAMERERTSRRVYEAIIEDLRTQLDTTTTNLHEVNQRLSDAKSRLLRMDELQEEVELYKETAKKVAIESHSVVTSASEAQERSERTAHEMHIRLRDLKSAEAELHSLRLERTKLLEDIDSAKVRVREMSLEKMGAERRLSEQIAKCARIEAVVDEYRLRAEAAELELSRSERMVQEAQLTTADLKAKRAESEKQRLALLEKLQSQSATTVTAAQHREGDRQLELENMRLIQSKEILEMEMDALAKSLRSQKQINAGMLEEMDRLRAELDRLQQERDLFHRDVALHESGRTELQLHELRRELAKTVDDWQDTENTKESYEELSVQATARLDREKEKTNLLQTQVTLLEERLHVLSQELAVFRSLDIYHTSMDAELRQYRMAASSPLPRRGFRSQSPSGRTNARNTGRHRTSYSGGGLDELDEDSSDDEDLSRKYPSASTTLQVETLAHQVAERSSLSTVGTVPRRTEDNVRCADSGHSNADDEYGPSLTLSDMSPSHSGRFGRERDHITPSLTRGAPKTPRIGVEGSGPSQSPPSRRSRSGSPGNGHFLSQHKGLEKMYRVSDRTSNGHARREFDAECDDEPDAVPKRESVNRPGLQLDGSLKRSSNHPVNSPPHGRTVRITLDEQDVNARHSDTSQHRVQRNLLTRPTRETSKASGSKPSKLEFERAKKLLARR